VDGAPIAVDELRLFMRKNRALARSGEWLDIALREAIEWKTLQRWAAEEKLTDDISYAALQEELDRFNRERRAALEKGEGVYGPERYDELTFMDRKAGEWRTVLRERLDAADEEPDALLQERYEQFKSSYVEPGAVRVWKWAVPVPAADEEAAFARIVEAMRTALTELKQGRSRQEVTDTMLAQGEALSGLRAGGQLFDDRSAKADILLPGLLDRARALAVGEASDVFVEDGVCYLLYGLERTEPRQAMFAEVKGRLALHWANEQFERTLQQRVREANVVRDEAALARLRDEGETVKRGE
jgi:hypothetical protein